MIREVATLEVVFTNVDINNLPYTPATNNTHDDEAATFTNLHSPPTDTLELITLSDASQTQPECNDIFTAYGTIL